MGSSLEERILTRLLDLRMVSDRDVRRFEFSEAWLAAEARLMDAVLPVLRVAARGVLRRTKM